MNVHMRGDAPKITPLLAMGMEALASRLTGRVVTADHSEYDMLRGMAHGNWDYRPLFIARVADAPDVAEVVDFARRNQLQVAVRSGGTLGVRTQRQRRRRGHRPARSSGH